MFGYVFPYEDVSEDVREAVQLFLHRQRAAHIKLAKRNSVAALQNTVFTTF
jgi:Arc/MetJ-type ribon-helix-helix transcriptional regulator